MRSNYFKSSLISKYLILIMITSLFIFLFIIYIFVNPAVSQSKINKVNTPHNSGIRLITFDKILSNIITVGYDGNIIKWDLNNLSKINSVKITRNDVTSISSNENNDIFSIGFKDGDVVFINTNNLSLIKSYEIDNNYNAISVNVSRDNDYFITINSDNSLKIYSFETGKLLKTVEDTKFIGYTPKINLKKRIIAFFSINKVILYSLHGYSIVKELDFDNNEIIYDVCFSNDGKELLVGGEKGIIYTIDTNLTFNVKEIHQAKKDEWVTRLATDNFKNIVYTTDKNDIYFLNRKSKKSYKLNTSQNDILNIDMEKYGRYFVYTA